MGEWALRFLIDRRIDATEGVRLYLRDAAHAWLYAALVGAVLAFSLWTYRRAVGRARPALRRWMIAARAAFLLALFCLLVRPSLHYSRLRTPVVAVLVDASASMADADPSGGEAYERAAAWRLGLAPSPTEADEKARAEARAASRARIAEALLWQPVHGLVPQIAGEGGEGYVVRVFELGAGLREVERPAGASDPRTDLAEALDGVERQLRGAPWLATLLVSDGNANSGDDPRQAASRIGDRGVPIHVIGLGGTEERKDVRLADVSSPELAFAGSRVPVHFTIAWNGFEGGAEVRLLEEGRELQTLDLDLVGGSGTIRSSFQVQMDAPGKRFLSIEVVPREGEATAANNARRFGIEGLEAFQLLYVTGTPDPEFAFLRRFLERDSQIRVTVLLRAPGGGQAFLNRSTRPVDRQLADFPDTIEALAPFQAVILGDIERDAFTSRQIEALRTFVGDRGGGFLMLGGMHSFGRGRWAGSGMEELLPVRLADGEEPVDDLFRVRLTPEGLESPFFQSSAGISWDALPAFSGMNGVVGAKPAATVLAVHPSRGNANGNWVACATARFGKGRVMALTVDETWRWRFQEAYDEKNPPGQVYRDFWGQVVRWLGLPPEREGLRLLLPKREFPTGEEVILRAQLLDAALEAIPGAKVSAEIEADGVAPSTLEMVPVAGEKGVFRAVVPSLPIGSYAVRGNVEGDPSKEDRDVFAVEAPTLEAERTARDHALLSEVARLSGGRYVDLAEAEKVPGWVAGIEYADRRSFREVGEAEIWDAWSALALLLAALAVEWSVRRKAGIL